MARSSAPQPKLEPTPRVGGLPQRRPVQLIASSILFALWLAFLAWMARTA